MLIPLHPVDAVWDWLVGIITAVPSLIIGAIIFLSGEIAALFVYFATILINWVVSDDFTTLSYTNPNNNEIIKVGLSVTQGLANMVLVIVLIYIGLVTILRLGNYKTEKLLITFIIVALLVNFAPVICGLVVDASNIIMNFFLQKITDASVITKGFTDLINTAKSGLSWNKIINFTGQMNTLFGLLLAAIFNFILFFILLAIALIFIMRYVVIWILVILSPLAFVSFILPTTRRKYWDLWWSQLLNWSFIGVTITFFLYLAELFSVYLNDQTITFGSVPDTDTNLGVFLPKLLPVIFLILGFIFALKTSAMGASTILTFTKRQGDRVRGFYTKQGNKVVNWAGGKVKQSTVGKLKQGSEFTRLKLREWTSTEKFRKWAENRVTARKSGEGEPGFIGWGKRWVRRTIGAPIYYPARSISQRLGKSVIEGLDKKIEKVEKDLEGQNEIFKLQAYHNATTDSQKIGILNSLIKEGQIDKVMDVNKFGKSAITIEEIQKLGNKAKKLNIEKNIIKAFPHLDLNSEEVKNTSIEEIKNRIKKIGPDIYSSISKEALKDTNTIDAILSTANGNNLKTLIDKHGETAINVIEERIKAGAPINPRLKRYLTVSPVGRTLLNIDLKEEKIVTKEGEKEEVTETKIIPGTETEFKKVVEEEKNKPKGRQVGKRKKPPKGRRP